jgi:hypothetical protein
MEHLGKPTRFGPFANLLMFARTTCDGLATKASRKGQASAMRHLPITGWDRIFTPTRKPNSLGIIATAYVYMKIAKKWFALSFVDAGKVALAFWVASPGRWAGKVCRSM